jgi:hypothetical protein
MEQAAEKRGQLRKLVAVNSFTGLVVCVFFLHEFEVMIMIGVDVHIGVMKKFACA